MWRGFCAVLRRDMRLWVRRMGGGGLALFFFFTVTVLVTLGAGANLATLSLVAPMFVWILAFLSCLLSLENMLRADKEEGALDLLKCSFLPLWMSLGAKGIAHWFCVGVPLTVAAPILGVFFNLEPKAMPILVITLGIGSLGLSFVGLLAAALTLPVRRGGFLAALLVVPLSMPILLSALSVLRAGITDSGVFGHLLLVEIVLVGCAIFFGTWISAVVVTLQDE